MSTITKLPEYSTELFTDIYGNVTDFLADYKDAGIPTTITDDSATTLFYLLYARYGNSPIANYDVNQWKMKLFSIVFMYGPTWERRLSIQKTLRDMSESDLMQGAKKALSRNSTVSNSNSSTTKNTGNDTVQNSGAITKSGNQTLLHGLTNTRSGQVNLQHGLTVTKTGQESTSNNTTNENVANHAYNPTTAYTGYSTDSQTGAESKSVYGKIDTVNEQNATKSTGNGNSTLDFTNRQDTQSGTDTTSYSNLEDKQSGTDTTTFNSVADTDTRKVETTLNDTHNVNGTSTDTIKDSSSNEETLGKLQAYAQLWELLDNDVTNDFLAKFINIFKRFAKPAHTWIYETEE